MTRLFDPWHLGALTLPNRIVIAPMCQYSAVDGVVGDWHLMHLGQLATSGAGLLIVEATAVEREGRITTGCVALHDDAQEAALARVVGALRANSPMTLAIQLGHAGRKASSQAPWEGGLQVRPDQPGGWLAAAPSALPHGPSEVPPVALDDAGLVRVRRAFADAAVRAVRAGFVGIELHAAHGYLLHEFLSPISNLRSDVYGGSLAARMRFPLEVFEAVRGAVPAQVPVWVRLSATDWVDGGWDLDSSIAFSQALKARGCSAIHVSSGGVSPLQRINLGPGYQVPFAQAIKAAVGLPTIACGLITEAEQADAIVRDGQADAVALARGILYDPHWPWHAAAKLGAQIQAPRQYWRSTPREVKDLFAGLKFGAR